MEKLEKIRSILRAHDLEIRERYGLFNLAVFGSMARGEDRETSDVDIIADAERPIGLIALCGAENFLTGLLGIKVDLVLRRSVRSELRDLIFSEAIAI
jgi:uncharacterized protein